MHTSVKVPHPVLISMHTSVELINMHTYVELISMHTCGSATCCPKQHAHVCVEVPHPVHSFILQPRIFFVFLLSVYPQMFPEGCHKRFHIKIRQAFISQLTKDFLDGLYRNVPYL